MRQFIIAAATLASSAIGSQAQAAIVVYTSQAAFSAAVKNSATDTFDDVSTSGPSGTTLNRTAGNYGYTATSSDLDTTGSSTGLYGGGVPANDPNLSTNYSLDSITFANFTGGVSAIGGLFFTSNFFGAFTPGAVKLTATDSFGSIVTRTIDPSSPSSFLGFVSTGAVSNLVLESIQPAIGYRWPTADDLMLAQSAAAIPAVPEPATWAMMVLGFGVVGASMRKRQRLSVSYA